MNVYSKESKFYIFNIVSSIIFLLLFSPYTTPLNPYYGYDDNIFMIIGQGINKGYVPYKDLFDHKGPILFFIYAIADMIWHGKMGLFILQIVNLFIINTCIFKMALLYKCSYKKIYIIIAIFMIYFIGTIGEGAMNEEFSLSFLMICFYLSLKYLYNYTNIVEYKIPLYISFLFGISFAIVFLIRANNSALICGIILGYAIILLQQKQYLYLLANIAIFLLGIGIVFLPVILYFIKQHAFDDFIFYSFTYNYIYAVGGIQNTQDYIMKIVWVLPTVILFIASVKFIKEEKLIIIPSLVISLFSVSLGNSYLHYYTLLLPLIVFFIIKLFINLNYKYFIMLTCICYIPYIYTSAKNIGKILYFDILKDRDEYYAELDKVYKLIDKKDKDKTLPIELTYKDYSLYTKYNMTPCCRFFHFQNKFMKDIPSVKKELLYNCKNAIPAYILIPNLNVIGSTEVRKAIDSNYRLIYKRENCNSLTIEVYKNKYNI